MKKIILIVKLQEFYELRKDQDNSRYCVIYYYTNYYIIANWHNDCL